MACIFFLNLFKRLITWAVCGVQATKPASWNQGFSFAYLTKIPNLGQWKFRTGLQWDLEFIGSKIQTNPTSLFFLIFKNKEVLLWVSWLIMFRWDFFLSPSSEMIFAEGEKVLEEEVKRSRLKCNFTEIQGLG